MTGLIKGTIQKISRGGEHAFQKIGRQFDRVRDRHICIGVTGLSQSGKSTFITSFLNQLIHHDQSNMAGFLPVHNGQLKSVKIHPIDPDVLAQYPYEQSYKKIASSNPKWPDSTEDISGCLLELRLSKKSSILNTFGSKQFSLFLEIRDYPGEWLLDLPLREMGYARWCAQCNSQYTQEPRASLLGDLLDELQQIDPLSKADLDYLYKLNQRFVEFLEECKHNGKSLSLIQPGRFLVPGKIEGNELLYFVPLLKSGSYTEGQLASASSDSYFKICEGRYNRYISELVEPFYKNFFSKIDRQIVLVDVINAINSGVQYIDDMRQALTNITDSFSYGEQSRIRQLFSPKIDKLIFAATKIDQVVTEDHSSAKNLLSKIVTHAYKNAQYDGVTPDCEVIAAVRSSKEIVKDGQPAISGRNINGEVIGYIHPMIPKGLDDEGGMMAFKEWNIPALSPPIGLVYKNGDVIPHIRMDTIINELIGDKCQ